jgi:hypothetical protein
MIGIKARIYLARRVNLGAPTPFSRS